MIASQSEFELTTIAQLGDYRYWNFMLHTQMTQSTLQYPPPPPFNRETTPAKNNSVLIREVSLE